MLSEATRMLRAHGLEVLTAEALVRGADGDLHSADAAPNPLVSLGYGHVFNYVPGPGQDDNQYTAGLSDQAAVTDTLWGKRGLRVRVAQAALAAARLGRDDALRLLECQVKQQYVALAQAIQVAEFSGEVAASAAETLELNRQRYPRVIDAGALARIETQKLEADQALDQAEQAVTTARVALAFLLGARGDVGDFDVDPHAIDYRALPAVAGAVDMKAAVSSAAASRAAEHEMMRLALEHRPDLQVAGYERARAQASVDLAKRQPVPDLTLSVQYTQTGTGDSAIQPPTLGLAVSAPIPVFYAGRGEIQRAEADYDVQSLAEEKSVALVVSDVRTAFAAFVTAQRLVDRMEGKGLLESAKTARDVTEVQFKAGSGSLIDFLDAQRTFIATKIEYLQDLTNYWTAIYQLEQAVGMEFQ
jgi:cobalt-zinc-cadmium efflux system outer membrane protein